MLEREFRPGRRHRSADADDSAHRARCPTRQDYAALRCTAPSCLRAAWARQVWPPARSSSSTSASRARCSTSRRRRFRRWPRPFAELPPPSSARPGAQLAFTDRGFRGRRRRRADSLVPRSPTSATTSTGAATCLSSRRREPSGSPAPPNPENRELEPFLGTPRVTRVTVVLSHTRQDSPRANGRNRPNGRRGLIAREGELLWLFIKC